MCRPAPGAGAARGSRRALPPAGPRFRKGFGAGARVRWWDRRSKVSVTRSEKGQTGGLKCRLRGLCSQTGGLGRRLRGLYGQTGGLRRRLRGLYGQTGGLRRRSRGLTGQTGGLRRRSRGLKGQSGDLTRRSRGLKGRAGALPRRLLDGPRRERSRPFGLGKYPRARSPPATSPAV